MSSTTWAASAPTTMWHTIVCVVAVTSHASMLPDLAADASVQVWAARVVAREGRTTPRVAVGTCRTTLPILKCNCWPCAPTWMRTNLLVRVSPVAARLSSDVSQHGCHWMDVQDVLIKCMSIHHLCPCIVVYVLRCLCIVSMYTRRHTRIRTQTSHNGFCRRSCVARNHAAAG